MRRAYVAREAGLIAEMERRAVNVAHTILAVSEEEADYFRTLGASRVVVVPNGVDCAAYAAPPERTGPPTILYVGSLAWPPNASAARFLAVEVLPMVQQSLPDARLIIVGKDPPAHLVARSQADRRVQIAPGWCPMSPAISRRRICSRCRSPAAAGRG